MNFTKLELYFHTLKYLKWKQLYYRIYYAIRRKIRCNNYSKKLKFNPDILLFDTFICSKRSFSSGNTFLFLNKDFTFSENINWNFSEHGKLWCYNLNYFDFLNQPLIEKEEGIILIKDFICFYDKLQDGNEAYPLSIRIVNWIKFISKYSIIDNEINQNLYNQYFRLSKNLEYHLLGNHLLENGFSLLFASFYFKDNYLLKVSEKVILDELKEQILDDGGHFELSPMYHQIILNRLLDCINLVKNNFWSEFSHIELLEFYASKMLSWLDQITFKNGDVPMVNDSTWGIAPTTNELFEYARKLDLTWNSSVLDDSGYRKFVGQNFESFIDVGSIGPDYIPGHSHADTFNFEVHLFGAPFIVDSGISTYENDQLRQVQRSTHAHNTVVISNQNSSNVWGVFRVAQRARVTILEERNNLIVAEHDGYKKNKTLHNRSFILNDDSFIINDKLKCSKNISGIAYLHFFPTHKIRFLTTDEINFSNVNYKILFNSKIKLIEKFDYNYSIGMNKTIIGEAVKIEFTKELLTIIKF